MADGTFVGPPELSLRSWLEPYPARSVDERARMRYAMSSILAGGPLALLFAGSHLGHGWISTATVYAFAGVGVLAIPFVIRWQRKLDLAVQLLIGIGFGSLVFGTSRFGLAQATTSILWLVSPVIGAGLLAGPRTLVVYAVLFAVYVLADIWLGDGFPHPIELTPAQALELTSIDAVGSIALIAVVVSAFIAESRTARQARDLALSRQKAENEERRLAEAAAREAEQAARAAAAAKSNFLATMSHEIRTPMNGVLGMAELLRESMTADPEQQEHLRILESSASALLVIIDDILDLSKLEAGKMQLAHEPYDVAVLCREVAHITRRAGRNPDVELRLVLPEDRLPTRGDPGRVRQILMNLLGNAMKFTSEGWVAVEVARTEPSRLRFEVRDTGIGISPDRLRKLFQPFEQGDASTTRRFGGTGLGLVISKRLAEAMGGSIGATSVEGRGSCFWFELPYEEAEVPEPNAAGETVEAPALGGGRVLVVDDNPVNRLVASSALTRLGLETLTASSGPEAIERVRAGGIDLVLMDVEMPEMDGLEATRILREAGYADLPVIGLSANVLHEQRRAGREAGMNAYLTKPLVRAELIRELGLHLGRTRGLRSLAGGPPAA